MYVSDWMSKKVFTLNADDYLSDALSLMKEKSIKHVPVVKNGKLKGILSDRDIKEYSPSKATSLDIYELHYLLAKTRIREIMKTRVHNHDRRHSRGRGGNDHAGRQSGCLPVVEEGEVTGNHLR